MNHILKKHLCRANIPLCLLLASCGAVHQMIPPAPLARNEFRGSLVISYDLNRFAPFSSLGMNFYWGAGKDYNIGFGYQPPFGISHLTAVKYFSPEKANSGNIYASLNGILLNTDYSPNLEMGASYLSRHGATSHTLSGGLWALLDRNVAEPLWKILFWRSTAPARFNPILRPFIRYELQHNDFQLSLRNNIGSTAHTVNWYRNNLGQGEIITLPNLDVTRVTFNAPAKSIQIQMNDSTIYRIAPNYLKLDILIPEMDIRKYRLQRFTPKDSLEYYYVLTLRPDNKSAGNRRIVSATLCELNYDEILADYAGKKDVVIGSNAERTAEILSKIHWYTHDWSVGIASRTKR